jgi:hypothetical protein
MVVPPNQITPASQFEDCSVQANAEDNLHADLKDVLTGAEKEQEDKLMSETVDNESGHVMVEDTNVVDDPALVLVEPVIAPARTSSKPLVRGRVGRPCYVGRYSHAQQDVAAPIVLEQVAERG